MLWAALFIFPGDRNPGMGYNDVGVKRSFAPQLMLTNCSAVKQLSQFYKHSKSADLLRKSLLSHVWRIPSSKALSCKHERLFELLTLASYNFVEWP